MTSLLPFSDYKRSMNYFVDKILAILLTSVFCVMGISMIIIGFATNDYKQALIGFAFLHMGVAIFAIQFKKKRQKKKELENNK